MTRLRAQRLVLTLSLAPVAACSAMHRAPGRDNAGTSAQAISADAVLSRAREWVEVELAYCQSPNGADDSIDPACSPVCHRQRSAAWDPYRSDCSGFISWAWGLPAPGRTTDGLAPADESVSFVVDGRDLQPGDALNIPGDHVVLFVSWLAPGQSATFYEEAGCRADPPYAHAFTSDVTIVGTSVYVAYEGKAFTAIRYAGVTGTSDPEEREASGPACTWTTNRAAGTCVDTMFCVGLGGHVSTPGLCPGPDNIECCTAAGRDGGS